MPADTFQRWTRPASLARSTIVNGIPGPVAASYQTAGKTDPVISGTVSRFVRSTVGSLTAIRPLKGEGTECRFGERCFEKENIRMPDGKGGVLAAVTGGPAREERRSISGRSLKGLTGDGEYGGDALISAGTAARQSMDTVRGLPQKAAGPGPEARGKRPDRAAVRADGSIRSGIGI